MARNKGGIFGSVSGKISGIVAVNGKTCNYIRAYSNQKISSTPQQLINRAKLTFLSSLGSLLLPDLIDLFWIRDSLVGSGFNQFIQVNFSRISDTPYYPDILTTTGIITPRAFNQCQYLASNGNCGGSWTTSLSGNQLSSDLVKMCFIDDVNSVAFVSTATRLRSQSPLIFNIGANRVLANLHAYIWFYRYNGDTLEVSDSVYHTVQPA